MPSKNLSSSGQFLLAITICLVICGLFFVTSAGVALSQLKFHQSYYYLKNQLWKGVVPGIILGLTAFFIPYKHWKKYSFLLLLSSAFLLLGVFIPGLGICHKGAHRWLNLGFFTIQPTEIVKLSIILYLAAWLENHQRHLKNFKEGLLPILLVCGIIGALILLEPDLGTLGVIALTVGLILFLGQAKISHLLSICLLGIIIIVLAIHTFPYAANRWHSFLHPTTDIQGKSYQIYQSLIALGSGGLFGRGLGKSLQKYRFLPEPVGDSIFAIIGEELGFIGTVALISLFFLFVYFCFRIAQRAPDKFGYFLVSGFAVLVAVQSLINLAAIIRIIPLTGITLPFISYGGTSLAVFLTGVGFILNIDRHRK